MASNSIRTLVGLKVNGVGGIELFASFVKRKEVKTLNPRVGALVDFMTWASKKEGFEWDGTAITYFESHLAEERGLARTTIRRKISFIRGFLACGEQDGIIGRCVYYQKRGRKPKTIHTELATFVPAPEAKKQTKPRKAASRRVKDDGRLEAKKALYRLFDLPETFSVEQLKKAYRHVASIYHPDVCRDKDANECFILCKDAFDFLFDIVGRTKYDFYVKGKIASSDITSLVRRANSLMRTKVFKRNFI